MSIFRLTVTERVSFERYCAYSVRMSLSVFVSSLHVMSIFRLTGIECHWAYFIWMSLNVIEHISFVRLWAYFVWTSWNVFERMLLSIFHLHIIESHWAYFLWTSSNVNEHVSSYFVICRSNTHRFLLSISRFLRWLKTPSSFNQAKIQLLVVASSRYLIASYYLYRNFSCVRSPRNFGVCVGTR